ncbi:MAG: hypothetical protein CL774_03670 [Chloroflexi bacterium]|nr:hypothetical protein [Chloroflexota bacterium]|tara:strand:+ start:37169 stop:38191 length:1023 start_codon:yes stop_codon:yes gene_type:complete
MLISKFNKIHIFTFFIVFSSIFFGCSSENNQNINIFPIVFSFSKNQNVDIYKLSSLGGELTQLTTDKSSETKPTWSPDKNTIAYLSDINGTNTLWIMDSNGNSKKEVLDSDIKVNNFFWSPDSKKIVAEVNINEKLNIIIIDLETTSKEILNLPYDKALIGDWSPDGKWLLFTVEGEKNNGIKRKSISGVDEFSITEENDYQPKWSPNGKWIAFVRKNTTGNFDLIYTNIYGEKEEILIKNNLNKIDYDWSSDSKNIIFSKKDKQSNMNEIFKVEIKNVSVKQLTFNRVNDINPRWNNKNSNIIFSSENQNILDLYSMLIDGSEQTRLTKNLEKFLDADW